jgi:putative FmdB family regulatory protein
VPTYTYTCTACNDVIEKRQSFTDAPLTTCEQCGGALRKVIHPVGIVFKGSGWYITDSRASSSSANGPSGSASSSTESKDSGGSASSASKESSSSSKESSSSSKESSSSSSSSGAPV